MGVAYRKNWKHLTGKDDITGKDSVELGMGGVQAIIGDTELETVFGATSYVVARRGFLDFAVIQINEASLGSGKLNFAVKKDTEVLASGSLESTNGRYLNWMFEKEKIQEVKVSDGDTLSVIYNVESTLDTTYILTCKLGLTYLEE